MDATGQDGATMDQVEEYFNSEDPRFLDALRQIDQQEPLAAFADRWKTDSRPWARAQVLEYLAAPLSCGGHQPLVKRLFKHAEAQADHELMAAFLVAFDRLVRRERRRRWHFDWDTSESWDEEYLTTPRNTIPVIKERRARNPRTGEGITVSAKTPRAGRLFSYRTRYYLRRRAWRYFRRMGYQRPDEYPRAVAAALARYVDDDLTAGENVMDSWGLVHACFHHSDALEYGTSTVWLKKGRSLGELQAAPYFPDLWKRPEAMPVLVTLLQRAQARLVRVWVMELLRRDHKEHLTQLDVTELLRLLDHDEEEIQQFGAELLEASVGAAKLPIETWLTLLQTKNPTALATICDVMKRLVSGDRLDLGQCVDVACSAAAPVAQLGLEFLKQREIDSPMARAQIARLADARCAAVAPELAAWALGMLGTADVYDRDVISRFFDSLLAETRTAAWEWLTPDSPGYDDAALWSRLLETPFDDVRLRLIDALQQRGELRAASSRDLTGLWCSVLLGVHRGGRQKQRAVAQVGAAIRDEPERAEELLPVMAVALRSVRAPERRAGLAAVVMAVERQPELADAVARFLPELDLSPAEVAG